MTALDLVSQALETSWQTALYLLAYALAPVWAVGATALLILLRHVEGGPLLSRGDSTARAVARTLLAALAAATSRAAIEEHLRRPGANRLETIAFLTVSHNLTFYQLLLIGPLLGKDVLLSHALGGVFFVVFALLLTPASSLVGTAEPRVARPRPPRLQLVAGELGRFAALAAWGLLLGGLIGAWGLSDAAFAPVDLVTNPLLSQLVNSLLALAASTLLWMTPVANLMVGTYLWKIGLAHAGLVTWFYASLVSPGRVRLYCRLWGVRGGLRLAFALAMSSVAAGLLTALLYGASDLTINYKLIPRQLLGW